MKFGTYMFEAKKVPGFDYDLFRVKPEVGRRLPPQPDMHSNIAIFGDNVTARNHPDWISQSDLRSSMENKRQLQCSLGHSLRNPTRTPRRTT